MNVWYQSEKRFTKKIIGKWQKRKFNYNAGHVNILKYAYQTSCFWQMLKSGKVSNKNKSVGYPTLF